MVLLGQSSSLLLYKSVVTSYSQWVLLLFIFASLMLCPALIDRTQPMANDILILTHNNTLPPPEPFRIDQTDSITSTYISPNFHIFIHCLPCRPCIRIIDDLSCSPKALFLLLSIHAHYFEFLKIEASTAISKRFENTGLAGLDRSQLKCKKQVYHKKGSESDRTKTRHDTSCRYKIAVETHTKNN